MIDGGAALRRHALPWALALVELELELELELGAAELGAAELDRVAGPHRLPKTSNLLDQEQSLKVHWQFGFAVQHTLHCLLAATTGAESSDGTHAQLPLYCLALYR